RALAHPRARNAGARVAAADPRRWWAYRAQPVASSDGPAPPDRPSRRLRDGRAAAADRAADGDRGAVGDAAAVPARRWWAAALQRQQRGRGLAGRDGAVTRQRQDGGTAPGAAERIPARNG